MKEGEKRKKIRKERGYVGILNNLLPLYHTVLAAQTSVTVHMMEGINKSLVSQKVTLKHVYLLEGKKKHTHPKLCALSPVTARGGCYDK